MALVIKKEDGGGLVDANAYADATDGDAYHEGHLYASAWTAASAGNKAAALVMATRLIDAEYQFNGVKSNAAQALQWPRYKCPDRDSEGLWRGDAFLSSDRVPAVVTAATCELARELLIADRTAAPPGEGLKYQNAGTTQTGYDKTDRRPILPVLVQSMLAKYGALVKGRSGSVRVVRT